MSKVWLVLLAYFCAVIFSVLLKLFVYDNIWMNALILASPGVYSVFLYNRNKLSKPKT